MNPPLNSQPDPNQENAELRARLEEAEETLRAIRAGEVDALVMGEEVYTLKGAETPYRLLIESMNEGAATLAPNGAILYCNQRFADMVATSAERVIGSSLWQFVVTHQQPIVHSLVATAQHAGARAELTFKTPAGPGLPVLLSLRPILMDSHTIGVVAADLSERKRAEEALRQVNNSLEQRVAERTEEMRRQREWLSVTLASIGDALIATDAAGHVSFLNPVAEALTGWSQQEALGQPVQSVFRIVDATTRIPGEDIVGRVLREGAIVKLANNTCLFARDGREVPIEDSAAPIKDSGGKVAGAVLVFHDVTEKRQAHQALRESEDRYRLLYDQNPDAVFVVDTAGRFVVANPACEVMSGYPIAELVQKSFMEICAPDQLARTVEDFERGVRECKSLQLVTALLRKDGRRVEVWVAGGPITAHGKTVTVHCTARDITERKRMEEEIRRGAEELRATNQELTRFNEVMVGRELRMIELKQEINSLCAQFGQAPRYGAECEKDHRT